VDGIEEWLTMGEIRVGRRLIKTSSEDRVVFPRDGITKGEIVDYYCRIAPFMIPHVRKRRLTMQRFQPNIDANAVFQKDMPEHFPDWVHRATVPKHGGEVTHVVADNAETLVYIANQGCLTPHVGLQRVDKNDYPDQMVFDLDPPSDDFTVVRDVAFKMRGLLDELGLSAFLKTTGSRGLHLVVPLDRKLPFDEIRAIAHSIGVEMARRDPEHVTMEFLKKDRGERLFLDVNRNGTAQTAVPAFAVRAKDGAPVAMPITWEELEDAGVNARTWNIRNALERIESIEDPWAGFAKAARSLRKVQGRLSINAA
jgi:bifunctional non-homologous end joining protein LigD